ncbi:MAG: hypothetical protein WA784_11680 [Albidovulum sp.]
MTRRKSPSMKIVPALVSVGRGGVKDAADHVLDAEVGAMPMAFGTAHNLLTRAEVRGGTRVLVVFSGQPVGYAALRLAAIRGAKVFALCDPGAAAVARAAGARVVDRAELTHDCRYDAIINLDDKHDLGDFMGLLVGQGRYVAQGILPEPSIAGATRQLFLNNLTPFDRPHRPREIFAGMVTLITAPHLSIVPKKANPGAANE